MGLYTSGLVYEECRTRLDEKKKTTKVSVTFSATLVFPKATIFNLPNCFIYLDNSLQQRSAVIQFLA